MSTNPPSPRPPANEPAASTGSSLTPTRPIWRRFPAAVASGLVRGYQLLISPVLHSLGGPGAGCRFAPTCSEYAREALQVHGLIRGSWLALRRLLRCHPFNPGGFDPVPPRRGGLMKKEE